MFGVALGGAEQCRFSIGSTLVLNSLRKLNTKKCNANE